MKKTIYILILLGLFFSFEGVEGYCQFTINYHYTDKSLGKNFYIPINTSTNYTLLPQAPSFIAKLVSFKSDKSHYITQVTYSIWDTMICQFADGIGHLLVIMPRDSIDIFVKKKETSKKTKNKNLQPWLYDLRYIGKNQANYQLLDQLALETGPFSHSDQYPASMDPDSIYDQINSTYLKRFQFLISYIQKNKTDKNIQLLVLSDINFNYCSNLLNLRVRATKEIKPFHYKKIIDSLIREIRQQDFFNNAYYMFHITEYSPFVSNYYTKYLENVRKITPENIYRAIDTQFKDSIERNYLLSSYLFSKIQENDSSELIKKLYHRYKQDNPFYPSILLIDEYYTTVLENRRINLASAFLSVCCNKNGKELGLDEVSDMKKPIFIDCWGSKNKNSVSQLSILRKIIKQYSDKISFITLSFDEHQNEWISALARYNPRAQNLRLKENFHSNFARYFKINSIPRFILIGKNGKTLSYQTDSPSEISKFKKSLASYLENDLNQ